MIKLAHVIHMTDLHAYLTEIKALFRDGKESLLIGTPKQATLVHEASLLERIQYFINLQL